MWTYISKRILGMIWDQHVAASGMKSTDLSVSATTPIPGVGLSVARKLSAGRDNLYWLADRATEAISDLTGTLEEPTGAPYVRGTGVLRWGQLPIAYLMEGEEVDISEFEYTIAWLTGDIRLRDGSRIFVGMGGTIHNYIGFDPGDGTGHYGWFPSSPHGLANIVRAFGKFKDEEADTQLAYASSAPKREYDDGLCTSSEVVQDAIFASKRLEEGWWVGEAPKEFLMQVFFEEHDYDSGQRVYRHALVGTPLWVRDPQPRPIETRSRWGRRERTVWGSRY